MKDRKESDVKRAILDYLRARGYFALAIRNTGIKKPNGAYIPAFRKGIADIFFAKDGVWGWCEVKTSKGDWTLWQKAFLEEVKSYGGIAFVARSVDNVIAEGL